MTVPATAASRLPLTASADYARPPKRELEATRMLRNPVEPSAPAGALAITMNTHVLEAAVEPAFTKL